MKCIDIVKKYSLTYGGYWSVFLKNVKDKKVIKLNKVNLGYIGFKEQAESNWCVSERLGIISRFEYETGLSFKPSVIYVKGVSYCEDGDEYFATLCIIKQGGSFYYVFNAIDNKGVSKLHSMKGLLIKRWAFIEYAKGEVAYSIKNGLTKKQSLTNLEKKHNDLLDYIKPPMAIFSDLV